jgi:hypothetical protein
VKQYALLTLTFFLLGLPIAAQDEEAKVVLPDSVMQQVVSRVVKWHFRPARKPRTVYISEVNIKAEWLPEIKNIKFQLVPRPTDGYGDPMHFFGDLTKEKTGFLIVYAFGQPDCDANGETWFFRVIKGKVKLSTNLGGFGAACGANAQL